MATTAEALTFLNTYWLAPLHALGYESKTVSAEEVEYWRVKIEELGMDGADGAVALAQQQPAIYAAAHPLPALAVVAEPVNPEHDEEGFSLEGLIEQIAAAFGVEPRWIVLGGIVIIGGVIYFKWSK